jgi:uncharacterized protein
MAFKITVGWSLKSIEIERGKPPFPTCNLSDLELHMRSPFILLVVLSIALCTSCTRVSQKTVRSEPTSAPQPSSRFPTPTGLVNDYANVLNDESRLRLEALLTKLKTKTNIEFAIVTIETTKGEPIFDYSMALAREWGIGPKDPSIGGGMLLVLAIKDREWRLQNTRSLEKDLPDDVCKKLGDDSNPFYESGDYAGGVEKLVTALIDRLEQQRGFSLE